VFGSPISGYTYTKQSSYYTLYLQKGHFGSIEKETSAFKGRLFPSFTSENFTHCSGPVNK